MELKGAAGLPPVVAAAAVFLGAPSAVPPNDTTAYTSELQQRMWSLWSSTDPGSCSAHCLPRSWMSLHMAAKVRWSRPWSNSMKLSQVPRSKRSKAASASDRQRAAMPVLPISEW